MSAPKQWWDDLSSKKPGPARIRVTLNRDLTHAEREFLREVGSSLVALGDKLRVADASRIYVESTSARSRQLFEAVSALVANSFVNVYPVAVRTFRELVREFASGGVVLGPGSTERSDNAGFGTIDEILVQPRHFKWLAK
jgi:hypothetical protein